jgi:16S rRNA (cytosine1402-N4)-methyltransferase
VRAQANSPVYRLCCKPMYSANSGHDPVLMNEVLDALSLQPGQTIIDCTLGRGGHSRAIGERLGKDGLLVALDVDPRNLAFANERLKGLECPVRLFEANFAQIDEVWEKIDRAPMNGILADLGLSTNQLFDEHYGLSFATPMPLDMRIDPNLPQSAADLVNKMPESDLANVLYELAQERHSRRIARKIAEARRISPILTTDRLADLVRSAIPRGGKHPRETIDPATRTFLALRMKVNRETENLERLLEQSPRILGSGGRLAVISFQSTEDRMVKQAFRSAEQTGQVRILTPRPITPSDDEIARNPRSRSAKLRVVEKTVGSKR